jgi:hypothetical protein
MEKIWNKQFDKAKEIIFKKGGDEVARRQIAQFRGVSEKAILIQKLFSERNIFLLFQRRMAARDFSSVMDLIKRNPFLRELPEYEQLLQYFDKHFIMAQKEFQAGNYAKAMQSANILLDYPDYANDAKDLLSKADKYAQFYSYLADENMPLVYELIKEYPYLAETDAAIELEEDWEVAVVQAESYATTGVVAKVQKLLEPYFTIELKYSKMASIFKRIYYVQLTKALRDCETHTLDVKGGISKFCELFGIDDESLELVESYNKQCDDTMDIELLHDGNIELWTPKEIVASIVE